MEISPVVGVRIAPMLRSKETDLGLTDVYEVERPARTGDETYTPSGAKAATGYEDDEDGGDDPKDGAEAEPSEQPAGSIPIDCMA
jgi:hypothetical protein